MKEQDWDVIIVGGSFSGLAAAMALGRSLRKVLVIDSGSPCNRSTPFSHNFLTQDGKTPSEVTAIAREQVKKYNTVQFFQDVVTTGQKTGRGFEVGTGTGKTFHAKKLIFATGIKDILSTIPGFAECWGITALHCPYCHGYEVRNVPTGILGNGEYGYEFSALISNWTRELTLFTHGPSTLTALQTARLQAYGIEVVEQEIEYLDHTNGHLQQVQLKNGSTRIVHALYARPAFVQHSNLPADMGCEINQDGYVRVDQAQKTTVAGIFACGDNTTRLRTVANAVATGTTAGMMVNKELVEDAFSRYLLL